MYHIFPRQTLFCLDYTVDGEKIEEVWKKIYVGSFIISTLEEELLPSENRWKMEWSRPGARQGGVRVVGWPPWMLDHGQWPPWIWAMFRIFYQVIFPVNKQGSIESPPTKQRLENDAKEREKQTIVAKKQLVGLIMQAVIGAHCKNFTGSRAYVASFIRCGSDSL